MMLKLSKCVRTLEDLHDYQREAEQFMYDNPMSAIFIDLGMGKTVSVLTLIRRLYWNYEVNSVLIIAPKRVAIDTWPTEIGLWGHTVSLSHRYVKHDAVSDAANRSAQECRKTIMMEVKKGLVEYEGDNLTLKKDKPILTERGKLHIERARIKGAREVVQREHNSKPCLINIVTREQIEFIVHVWGKKWPYDCVIVDESDSLKSNTTVRYKALKSIMPHVTRMHQLTATPASESYLNLFAQIKLLDGGERLGRNMTMYKANYFNEDRYTRAISIREGSVEKISAKIADITLVMKAEDYLPKQEASYLYNKINLPADSLKKYRSIERDMVLEIIDGDQTVEVEAINGAALVQKLLQLSSGILYNNVEYVTDEEGEQVTKVRRDIYDIHSEKIEQLKVIMEESTGENVLVSYWHNATLDKIKKAFPYATVMSDKDGIVDEWNRGKIRMLLVHPDSAAHGLNLQHGGRRLVIYDMFWSNGKYLQLVGRLKRQGQKKVVFIHHLVANGTIDELVIEVMKGKYEAQETLFKLLRKFKRLLNMKDKV